MSIKAGLLILIASFLITCGIAMFGFIIESPYLGDGFPFKFSTFNLLGSDTNYAMLFTDIAFWFVITWLSWYSIKRFYKKTK